MLRDTLKECFEIRLTCILLISVRSGQSERNLPTDQAVDGVGMNLSEAHTHSFIVKVWIEETAEEAGQSTWRSHVTHVLNGERRYVEDLDAIAAFIVPYLERMGVRFQETRPIPRWLGRSDKPEDGSCDNR